MLLGQVKFTPVIVGVVMTSDEQLKDLKISVMQLCIKLKTWSLFGSESYC